MAVEIREVKTKSDIKKFVDFQFRLYKNEKMWVPPLRAEEVKALMPEFNPAFRFCDTCFWLAIKENKVVGRIGAIINKRYNEINNRTAGRFTRLEFIDDAEVVDTLLTTAENWIRSKGMTEIEGPLGFTNLDHQAMLIEGFDHLPSIASEYHRAYYKAHLERLGYAKEIDWIEFRITIPNEIPEKVLKVCETLKERMGISVLAFKNKEEMMPWAHQLFAIFNKAFSQLFSFVPFDDELTDFYVKKYIPVLSPRFVKIILDKEKKPIGFIIAIPSLSEAMQKAKGSVFPFGWYHLMKAYKQPDTIDLMLTGIDPELQGMGYVAMFMVELQKTALENGVRYAETTGMLENNYKAIQNWKNYEHIQHKRKRCFIKQL